jgi:hypothetical protein
MAEDTTAENLAFLIKIGQIKDPKTPAPITTKDKE